MQDVKATGYDSLCQTGAEEDSQLFWRSYRTFQGLKTNPFLSQGLSQTPTRGHAEGFGGKVDKTDNQTRPNWNGVATNERERVGVVPLGLDVPKNPVFMRVSGLGTFRATVFATDKIVPLGLQLNLKIA